MCKVVNDKLDGFLLFQVGYGIRRMPTTLSVAAYGVCLLLCWLRHTEYAYYFVDCGTRRMPTTFAFFLKLFHTL